MPIEATTVIDYDAYRKYFLFNFLQGKKSPWQARLLLALPPLMAAAFLILYLMDPADMINLVGLFLALAFGVLLMMILFVTPRRYYRAVEKLITIPIHYWFSEDSFRAGSEGFVEDGEPGLAYNKLFRAYETPEYFYLYLQANQPMILGKNDFSQGTAEDLRKLLERKLGRRFQITKSARKLIKA